MIMRLVRKYFQFGQDLPVQPILGQHELHGMEDDIFGMGGQHPLEGSFPDTARIT